MNKLENFIESSNRYIPENITEYIESGILAGSCPLCDNPIDYTEYTLFNFKKDGYNYRLPVCFNCTETISQHEVESELEQNLDNRIYNLINNYKLPDYIHPTFPKSLCVICLDGINNLNMTVFDTVKGESDVYGDYFSLCEKCVSQVEMYSKNKNLLPNKNVEYTGKCFDCGKLYPIDATERTLRTNKDNFSHLCPECYFNIHKKQNNRYNSIQCKSCKDAKFVDISLYPNYLYSYENYECKKCKSTIAEELAGEIIYSLFVVRIAKIHYEWKIKKENLGYRFFCTENGITVYVDSKFYAAIYDAVYHAEEHFNKCIKEYKNEIKSKFT